MQLSRPTLTRNTLWVLFALLSLSAYDNAVLDIAWLITAGWALVYLSIGVLKPRLDGAIRLFVSASLLYALVNAVYFGLHYGTHFDKPEFEATQLFRLLSFLLPVFVAARLATTPRQALLQTVWRAAAVWGLVTLPLAAYQVLVLGLRAEAGIGNAIPFALMGSIFSLASLLGLLEADRRWRLLAAIGYAAGLFCVMFSQTKSMMLVPLVGLFFFALLFFRGRLHLRLVLPAAMAVLLIAAVGFYVSGSMDRFHDLFLLASGDPAARLGGSYMQRLDMWAGALQGILDAPMSGHGFQNRRYFVGLLGYDYNHWHNGFLIAAFDNGIPGLIIMTAFLVSPLVIALRAGRDALYAPRVFLASVLVFAYAFGGMVNQIFGHGVYDALFLWIGTIIAVSATPEAIANVEPTV